MSLPGLTYAYPHLASLQSIAFKLNMFSVLPSLRSVQENTILKYRNRGRLNTLPVDL